MAVVFLAIAFMAGVLPTFLQPLMGKMLLPVFGGSAMTWNSVFLVFSSFTLISAFLVTGLVSRLSHKSQALYQVVLSCFALFFFSERHLLTTATNLSAFAQISLVFLILLPFMLVTWGNVFLIYLKREHHGFLKNYPLLFFATAFLGVASGLFTFHLLEPVLPLSQMFAYFERSFLGFLGFQILTFLGLAFFSGRLSWLEEQDRFEGKQPYLSWAIIPFVTSFLLLGFTHLISSEFTSFPFMWILPMGVFALSLFVAFLNPYIIPTTLFFVIMMLTAIPLMMIHIFGETLPTIPSFALHAAFYVSSVVLLHKALSIVSGRIAHPRFFMCFMTGQFLAALFSISAPFIFRDYVEYPLVMVLAIGIAALFWREEIHDALAQEKHKVLSVLLPFIVMLGVGVLVVYSKGKLGTQQILLLSAVMASSLAMLIRTPLLLAMGLGGLVLTPHLVKNEDILFKDRSFYGLSQVQNWHGFRLYTNGSTIHGAESLQEKRAVTYYNEQGPIGRFFYARQNYIHEHPVAVLGLGIGALTPYFAPNQRVDFYELDPLVPQIAKKYFSYLKNSLSDIDIIMGDGRLELEKADQEYGLIVIDAFSSDAIPTHLLTREAFQVYLSKLREDGLLLVNITNRYLNLFPVLASIARDQGLSLVQGVSNIQDNERLIFRTEWVALSRVPEQLEQLADRDVWFKNVSGQFTEAVWKDDFVDIKPLIKK